MKAISENTHFKTDIKTLAMVICAIAIAVWTYSEINNRLTKLETSEQLMKQDLLEASTQKPIDQEQFMLIEHMAGLLEQHTKQLEGGMHNKVNIEFLKEQVIALQADVE